MKTGASAFGVGAFQYEAQQLLGTHIDVVPTFTLPNVDDKAFVHSIQSEAVPLWKIKKKLQDILAAIEAIEPYSVSSYDEFLSDSNTQDAILYNLIIIDQAANQITDEFQEKHSMLSWSSMIGTRNIIVHGYDQVKFQIIWEILQRDQEHIIA